MKSLRMLAPAALVLSLAGAFALGSAGCYAFQKHETPNGAYDAPDSTSMAVDVDNRSGETVRVLAGREGNLMWLGSVSSLSRRTLQVPADMGAGTLTFALVGMSGRQWSARGIFPRAGAVLALDVDPDIRMSTWSMR